MRVRVLVLPALVCLLSLTLFSASASADSLTVAFSLPSQQYPPPGSGPWGTLNLVLNSNGTITATLNMAPGFVTNLVAFNIPGFSNPSGFVTVTGLPYDWKPCHTSAGSPFGDFNCTVYSDSVPSFVFGVSNLQLTFAIQGGFTSVYDIAGFSTNSPSIPVNFYIQLLDTTDPSASLGVAAAVVPEPATLILLASGIGAIALRIKRRV